MRSVRVIITDLDNTIYNWVDFYIPCYLSMVSELSAISGVPEEKLKASFKRLHEKYRTSEHSLAVHELDVLLELNRGLSGRQVYEKYALAIKAFQKEREKRLKLYPGVKETLIEVRSRGKRLVAHTDALMFQSSLRLKHLGVEDVYDAIFAPPDHGFPKGVSPRDVRKYEDPRKYESTIPIQVVTDPGLRKPDVRLLKCILQRMGVAPDQALYVGDSNRDVVMAQRCGVWDVHARYGRLVEARNYEELLKITYWNGQDFALEAELRNLNLHPTFAINSFAELIQIVDTFDGGDLNKKAPA